MVTEEQRRTSGMLQVLFCIFKKVSLYFLFMFLCVSVCGGVHAMFMWLPTEARRGQWILLELALQFVVCCLIQVLGT